MIVYLIKRSRFFIPTFLCLNYSLIHHRI